MRGSSGASPQIAPTLRQSMRFINGSPRKNANVPTRPGIRKGFTLIELLVVIAIIAVLIALSYRPYSRPARRADA